MKHTVLLFLLVGLTACTTAQVAPAPLPTSLPTSTSIPIQTWMGQTPPGSEPVPFGVGFLPASFHSSVTFAPDGSLAFWGATYSAAKIFTSRMENGSWTKPTIINFTEEMRSYRDPFLSPDGLRLYFISEDPLPGSQTSGKENIWMMEKEGDGWGKPYPLPESINALELHWTISVANNYNLYFSANSADLYLSRYLDGKYTDPILLDTPVSTESLEFTPNIAPDESYLLFSRLASSESQSYLYITYSLGSGWSEPQKIENIYYCISPIVTPDRKYVIYLSSPHTLEWRDTSFIDALRPD
jgi:hypothetical protein